MSQFVLISRAGRRQNLGHLTFSSPKAIIVSHHVLGRRLAEMLRVCVLFLKQETTVMFSQKITIKSVISVLFFALSSIYSSLPFIFWVVAFRRPNAEHPTESTNRRLPSMAHVLAFRAVPSSSLRFFRVPVTLTSTAPPPTHSRSRPATASAAFSSVPDAR